MSYDSRPDTHEHIAEVRGLLLRVVSDLLRRAHTHDQSKLDEPERDVFDQVTPQLRGLTYGSDEYKAALATMEAALEHHYAYNSHHPEHWPNGIADMGLLDVMEMLCDWMAATKRHADGDIRQSIEINSKRFGYGGEIKRLLLNTLREFDDLDTAPTGARG